MSSLMSQARTRVPRIAEAAVERARLTVVPRTAPRASRTPFVTLVSLLALTGVVGLLLFNTSMQQSAFVATSLQTKADSMSAKQQSLEMELEVLRDPQKVATRAKRLGMVPAPSPAFIRLSDGKVLGSPEVARRGSPLRINPLPAVKPRLLDPRPLIIRVPAPDVAAALPGADGASHAARASGAGTKKRSDRGQGSNR